MAYDEGLTQRIREHLQGKADVTERKRFGGLAFMLGDHMLVGPVKFKLPLQEGCQPGGPYLKGVETFWRSQALPSRPAK